MNADPTYFKIHMHYHQCKFKIANYEKTLERLQSFEAFAKYWNPILNGIDETQFLACTRCPTRDCVALQKSTIHKIFDRELIEISLDMTQKIKSYLMEEENVSDQVEIDLVIMEMYLISQQ